MTSIKHPPYHYHAHAHAFSGELVRPIKNSIEAQAGVSLPYLGGHGRASVENFSLNHLVTFRQGYSHVSGSKGPNGNHTSHTTVAIEGLNILDVVTADHVVARLTSDHDPAEREGHIITMGSRFDNLRISGCPVDVELDHELFLKAKNITDLSKQVASLKKSGRIADESNGVVICSLVKKIDLKCSGTDVQGHVVIVPQFGKIHFGELISSHGSKRITMMRLELGSPVEGQLVMASAFINGTPFP